MSRGMETTIVGQMLWGWKRWVKQGWPYVSSRHVQNKRGRPKFKSKAAKHIQNISATQNVPAMYLHLTSRLSHLPCMLKRKDLTKKKTKNSHHLLTEVSLRFQRFHGLDPAHQQKRVSLIICPGMEGHFWGILRLHCDIWRWTSK